MNKTGDGRRAPATVHHSLVFAEKVRVSTRAPKNHLPRFRGRPINEKPVWLDMIHSRRPFHSTVRG